MLTFPSTYFGIYDNLCLALPLAWDSCTTAPTWATAYATTSTHMITLSRGGFGALYLDIFLAGLLILIFFSVFRKFLAHLMVFFSEKELNSLDDGIILLSMVLLFIFTYLSLVTGFWGKDLEYPLFFSAICILLGLIVTLLLGLLLSFGYYMIAFFKGSGASMLFGYELLMDHITVISSITRVLVQLVRLVLVTLTYYMTNELFLESLASLSVQPSFSSYTFSTLLGFSVHLVFEIMHLILLSGIQIVAFCGIIFWLLQFLYTTFLEQNLEQ